MDRNASLVGCGLALFLCSACSVKVEVARLVRETSPNGMEVQYQYNDQDEEPSAMRFLFNGMLVVDTEQGKKVAPSVYPADATIRFERLTEHSPTHVECVEYLYDRDSNEIDHPLRIVEATYYDCDSMETIKKATYGYYFRDYLQSVDFEGPDGKPYASLRHEYGTGAAGEVINFADPTLNVVSSVYTNWSAQYSRTTRYSWDGRIPAHRPRFMVDFTPEGTSLRFWRGVRSNLQAVESTTRDLAGTVLSTSSDQLQLSYDDAGRLTSEVILGTQRWDFEYEVIEVYR